MIQQLGSVRRLVLLMAVAALVAAIDLATKAWAASSLSSARPPTQLVDVCVPDGSGFTRTERMPTRRIEVLPVLRLKYAENCGGPFGFLRTADARVRYPVFVGATALAIVALVIVGIGARGRPLVGVALSLLTGGAIGNLTDRLRLGYVVDFLDLHVGARSWPTFNVADIGVTVGLALVVIDSLRAPKELDAPAAAPASASDAAAGPTSAADTVSAVADGSGTAREKPLDPPSA
ncbi:MAG: signal peptidase II [Deltaproteobacteria bacterium]|nr:signal peptidase II [Deltaproteobacteria bacterium]